MEQNITWLEETESTNSYIRARGDSFAHGDIVAARVQTAGRGQRGNSWESSPGENVTMSMFLRPDGVDITEAFPISEAIAIGVVGVLDSFLPEQVSSRVRIKWPNDIYVSDSKIAGILIENSLQGRLIDRSVAGIGLNVNQQLFVSDAPNPVSMSQLTGLRYDVGEIVSEIGHHVLNALEMMTREPNCLHNLYMKRLWRGDGRCYPFTESATGRRFMASVASVAMSGHITLNEHPSGRPLIYAFKEIIWDRL